MLLQQASQRICSCQPRRLPGRPGVASPACGAPGLSDDQHRSTVVDCYELFRKDIESMQFRCNSRHTLCNFLRHSNATGRTANPESRSFPSTGGLCWAHGLHLPTVFRAWLRRPLHVSLTDPSLHELSPLEPSSLGPCLPGIRLQCIREPWCSAGSSFAISARSSASLALTSRACSITRSVSASK